MPSKICVDGRIWGQNNKALKFHTLDLVAYETKEERKARYNELALMRYRSNPEPQRTKQRAQRKRRKIEVLTHYSTADYPVCARCGITDIDILCLDHINGDGAERRRETKEPLGKALYYYLKKAGFPDGLQVLCFNCNMKKRISEGK